MGVSAHPFDALVKKIRERYKDKSEADVGRAFERLLKKFFETDRHYARMFKKVWLWSDWPERVIPENPKGTDIGIDLVAERYDGDLCVIQSKFYSDRDLGDNDVLKFLRAIRWYSKYHTISQKIMISTGDDVTPLAQRNLEESGCRLLQKPDLRSSSVEWKSLQNLGVRKPLEARPYQEDAIRDVLAGFEKDDRGKLIMACGTGKTFVALKIAEDLVKKGGIILFLVPSISLIQQTMREWSNNTSRIPKFVAVCSDKSVKSSDEEGSIIELENDATTSVEELKDIMAARKKDDFTVIFSTYHSIKVVSEGLDGTPVDIVFCDEAHRTTGADVPKKNQDTSPFLTIHDENKIHAKRKLFMTATPRVYTGTKKDDNPRYSMGDDEKSEKAFGSTFHKLSFFKSVHTYKALSDFRVRICVLPRSQFGAYLRAVENDDDESIRAAKLAAAWHAMQYPDDTPKPRLLQRVIAFSNTISNSKIFSGQNKKDARITRTIERGKDTVEEEITGKSFPNIVHDYNEMNDAGNTVSVRHVDGSTRASSRRSSLTWLSESERNPHECRILSNARCLSEGVDVPALDAVVFLDPRKSTVDIVQSVGRVMRKAQGKEWGYVILPVVVEDGEQADDALINDEKFNHVAEVLNALRSHDDTIPWEVDVLGKPTKKGSPPRVSVVVMGVDPVKQGDEYMRLVSAVRSKLVSRVGSTRYVQDYGIRLGRAAKAVEEKLDEVLERDRSMKHRVDKLQEQFVMLINDSVDNRATRKILAQHVILRRVFDELFSGDFTTSNPLATMLNETVMKLDLESELYELNEFFDDVKNKMTVIRNIEGEEGRKRRQDFIKTVYQNFFESTEAKEVEKHGIVYTPIPAVDFILHSAKYILEDTFGLGLNDSSVKILDPFTGTGTFIARLFERGLIHNNMYKKYKGDLHANEISLLAYYIAAVNIETTYSSLNGGRYVPFDGINYVDTFMMNPQHRYDLESRKNQQRLDGLKKELHNRFVRQRGSHVHIIVANPPYSMGQSNFSDENQNIDYPEINKRIEDTYLKYSITGGAKNSLFDSYIRAFRWASDRIGDSGIIAFITNASFIRSSSTDGLRASFEKEFDEIWCFDLRGDARTKKKQRQKEKGNVFGAGSRTPVAITMLVKVPQNHKIHSKKAKIRYKDIGDYLERDEKLKKLAEYAGIQNISDWKIIKPDKYNDWLDQRGEEFFMHTPMRNIGKSKNKIIGIFGSYSRCVGTSRDVWAYNSSYVLLGKNMNRHIEYCNQQVLKNQKINPKNAKVTKDFPNKIKKAGYPDFDKSKIRKALYRPFFKQWLYFDKIYNHETGSLDKFFPKQDSENLVICVPDKGKRGMFSAIITDIIPDLHIIEQAQCFPLYTYEGSMKKSNITNQTVSEYRAHYKDEDIQGEDIFYYVYAMLHHPSYYKKFAKNLTKNLPRIPMAHNNFWILSQNGRKLAELHLSFETCPMYELGKPKFKPKEFCKLTYSKKRIMVNGKMKSVNDTKIIKADGNVLFDNLPDIKYRVDGRTPVECIINRYKITIDNKTEIKNDPCSDIDIVAVIKRAVHVGVMSDNIIADLEKLEFEPKDWVPKMTGLDAFAKSDNKNEVWH